MSDAEFVTLEAIDNRIINTFNRWKKSPLTKKPILEKAMIRLLEMKSEFTRAA
tara:strand:- start:3962 stop:4120 length:159 start_codon:yes stop_codon:yes gene_type:complete